MRTKDHHPRTLIVGVDGSEGSTAAIDEAVGLAGDLGAAITFVFVRKPPSWALGHPFYERQLSHDLRRARATVDDAIATAASAGMESDAEILEGDAADEIVSFADNRHADLIVVGSRGHGALAGALLGSVSRAVAEHADIPVIVAKHRPLRHSAVA